MQSISSYRKKPTGKKPVGNHWHLQKNRLIVTLLLVTLMGAACNNRESMPEEPSLENGIVRPTITNDVRQEELQVAEHDQKLVVWAPLFFAQPEEGPALEVLSAVYRSFQESNLGIELIIQPKAETGISSLEGYLRSATEIAPAILPDIILVETQQMWPMVESFNIQPLAAEQVDTYLDNVYPFAHDAVSFNQQIYGIPYAASIIHMVYNRNEYQGLSEATSVPTSWSELLTADTTYLFPAVGRDRLSNDMLLSQYVGAGGQLTSDGTVVNPEALTALLNFMASSRENGLFPAENREMSTYAATWERFIAKQEGLVNVRSEQYLSQMDALADLGYATIPARSAQAISIGRVWAFVLITNDPIKRELALMLISQLHRPEVQGKWGLHMNRLPTHIDAFNVWGTSQPYYDFLRQQMDIALAVPNGASFAKLSAQIQAAELSVSEGEISAQEAALQVLNGE